MPNLLIFNGKSSYFFKTNDINHKIKSIKSLIVIKTEGMEFVVCLKNKILNNADLHHSEFIRYPKQSPRIKNFDNMG